MKMDAGVATALGASVAAVATVAAALAAGRTQRSAARTSARAQYREDRLRTYKNFLSSVDEFHAEYFRLARSVEVWEDPSTEARLKELCERCEKVWLDVALAGTNRATSIGKEITEYCRMLYVMRVAEGMIWQLLPHGKGRDPMADKGTRKWCDKIYSLRAKFIRAARKSLNDDVRSALS